MDKVKESVIVRGICAAIQAMQMPSFQNLIDYLKRYGYSVTKEDKS